MNYQEFCHLADTPLTDDEWQSTDETPATTQELQWRKGYEVLRAIRHRRSGHATDEDLKLIRGKTNYVISARDYRPNIRRT